MQIGKNVHFTSLQISRVCMRQRIYYKIMNVWWGEGGGGGGTLILFVEFNYIHVASENILESEEQQCICKKQYSPFDLRNIIW